MNELAEKIKTLRKQKGLTLEQVADIVGVGKSTVRKWETGMIANMRRDKIALLAKALKTSPGYLMGWEDEDIPPFGMPIKKRSFPVLGNVACGEPIYADEQHGTFIDASADIDADFCLIAKGDSMINVRIFDGDLLFIKKTDMVDNGEIAVVLVEDEATVKRVYYDRENNLLTLAPENPTHKPLKYSGAELEQIRILGKVVFGQYKIFN